MLLGLYSNKYLFNLSKKQDNLLSQSKNPAFSEDENIISNPNFDDGLNNWSGRGCQIVLREAMADGKIVPSSGKFFTSATNRTGSWNGIQQDITGKVQRKLAYQVVAVVFVLGNNGADAEVRATLLIQAADDQGEHYIGLARIQLESKPNPLQMQEKFLLNCFPSKVIIFLEGPPPGTDILVNGLVIKHAEKLPLSPPPVVENPTYGVNIVGNSSLNDGINGWFPLGNCTLSVEIGSPRILPPMARDLLGPYEPLSGSYILVSNRTETSMGPAQMITDKVKLYLTYQLSA
ncbi:unnamed protein product [Coffea canephora]|uniref:CBM-cenC domain-containing protein n=1 Tax=Coffea canephora TaxID=49390 RepID=A0A068U049_COFCA|nr:unnamed protein product [Coffea canephora]